MITIFRALQGMFAAFTVPLARLTIVKLFSHDYVHAMIIIAPFNLIGAMLGPLIGGMVTTWLNWRFIFFLNVPIGILAIILIRYCFPTLTSSLKYKFDYRGFLLIGLGLALALFAIDTVIDTELHTSLKIIVFLLSLGLFISYYFYAKHKQHSIINIKLFKKPVFNYLIATSVSFRVFTIGLTFLIPLYLQTQFKYSALQAGLVMVTFITGALLSRFFVRKMFKIFAYRILLVSMLLIVSLSEFVISYLLSHFHLIPLLLMLLIIGYAMPVLMSMLNSKIYTNLDPNMINDGTTINSAAIQLSGSFSVAIIALILIIISGQYMLDWQQVLPKSSYSIVMLISGFFMLLTCAAVPFSPKEIK